MGKSFGDQSTRRTAAIASLKVGWRFCTRRRDGGEQRCWVFASAHAPRRSPANSVRAALGWSAGWPGPTTAAASRRPGVRVPLERLSRSASGTQSEKGSRRVQDRDRCTETPAHRAGRTDRVPGPSGSQPEASTLYQTAVLETYSSLRVCPPYHSVSMTDVQTVFGSASTALSLGRRLPFSGGWPIWPGRAFASRFEQAGIKAQPCDQADLPAHRGDQLQRGETAVGDDNHAAIRQPAFALQYCLTRPVGQRLVPPALPFTPASRRRQHGQEWQAQRRPANGTGSITASDSQRRPLVLTNWPCDDRTGSR